MEIKRTGWLYRYATMMESSYSNKCNRQNIDLCTLFWKAAGVTLFCALMSALCGLLIFLLFVKPFREWGFVGLLAVPGIASVGASIVFAAYWLSRDDSFLREAYKGIKDNYCPTIHIKD